MIFGVAVVLPLPDNARVLQVHVTRLQAAIEDINLQTSRLQHAAISNVLLWILVIGGVAALDKPERPWFVSRLGMLIRAIKMDWNDVKEVLKTFLWLDSACDFGGRQLWAQAAPVEYSALDFK